MDLQVGKVRRPGQCWKIVDEDVPDGGPAAFARDRKCLHPFRRKARRILFIEEFAAHTVRVALQRHGTVMQMGQQERRDAHVIINDLSFGEAGWIEDLLRVRNRNLLAIDGQVGRASRAG